MSGVRCYCPKCEKMFMRSYKYYDKDNEPIEIGENKPCGPYIKMKIIGNGWVESRLCSKHVIEPSHPYWQTYLSVLG